MAIWQLPSRALLNDDALKITIIDMFERVYLPRFSDSLSSNPSIKVQIHSIHYLNIWKFFLVLTPWMLTHLLIPDSNPGIEVPLAEERGNSFLLGPLITFTVLDTQQKAHINFDPRLGHYLMQPLIFGMERYADSDAVLDAWRNMQKKYSKSRDILDNKVSRRSFFSSFSSKIPNREEQFSAHLVDATDEGWCSR